jgi:hypothetical protein
VLLGGAELTDKTELGDCAQRAGVAWCVQRAGWRMEVTGVLAGGTELGDTAQRPGWGAAQAAVTQRAGGAFPPHIRLPPQGTSLGLCEPPLGASLSSRAASLRIWLCRLGETKQSRQRETEQRRTLTQWKQIKKR